MTGRRILVGTAAVGLIVSPIMTATAALAQPTYPPTTPPTPMIAVSSTTARVGDLITVSGVGWLPGGTVTLHSFVGGTDGTQHATTMSGRAAAGAAVTPKSVPIGDTTKGHGRPDGKSGCATGRTCAVRVDAAGDFLTGFLLTKPGNTLIVATGLDGPPPGTVHQAEATVAVSPAPYRHHRENGSSGDGGGSYGEGHSGHSSHSSHSGYSGHNGSDAVSSGYGGGGYGKGHHHDKGKGESGGASEGSLAYTGAPVLGMSIVGLGLVAFGTALAAMSRRRRRTV